MASRGQPAAARVTDGLQRRRAEPAQQAGGGLVEWLVPGHGMSAWNLSSMGTTNLRSRNLLPRSQAVSEMNRHA